MRSPALALAWQLWSRSRVSRWTCLGFIIGTLVIIQAFTHELDKGERDSASLCLCFGAIALMTGLITSWALSLERTTTEAAFPRWMLTLPVRTEALIGWPMLYGTVFIGLAWPVWVWLVLGPPAPLVWPAFLFAAAVAWFQALTTPGPRSLRRSAGNDLALGLLTAGILLLVDQCLELRGEKTVLLAGATSLPEAGLAAGFAAMIAVAYAVGVSGLAAFRRGDVRPRARVLIDQAWLSGWLPQPTGPFSAPARAQLWLEWRLRGAWLPFFWALLQVCLLVAVGITLLLMYAAVHLGLDIQQTSSEVRHTLLRYAWCVLPVLIGFLMMQIAPVAGMGWDRKLQVGTMTPLTALRPLTTWALARARLQALTIGLLAMWFLVVSESGVLFLMAGARADVTAVVDRYFPEWNELAFLAVAAVGGFVFLWKQLAQTMFFGLSGRWWVALPATVVHALVMWVLVGVVVRFADNPESSRQWLRDAQSWLVALAGVALVLKLLAAAWAIQANDQRQLLTRGALLRIIGWWVLTVVGLTLFLVWLMPAGFAPLGWLAGGVALALPLTRILLAPLVLCMGPAPLDGAVMESGRGRRRKPADLLTDVRELILSARAQVAQTVNASLTMRYWQVGDRVRREILLNSRAQFGSKCRVACFRGDRDSQHTCPITAKACAVLVSAHAFAVR